MLVRVDPDQLDRALRRFDAARGSADDAIAIDGKTMRNAIYTDARAPQAEARAANGDAKPATGKIGENQCQVHILGAVGQRDGVTLTQKKSTACRSAPTTRPRRTNEIGTVVPMLEGLELDFAGKTFTADALLTQRKLADFLRARGAHCRVHRQGQPAHPPRRPPGVLREPRRARRPRALLPPTRAPRKPRHLDQPASTAT